VCGGCRLQHLTPAEQRRVKRELVEQALRRIGGLDVSVPDLVAVGSEFGYRNRVTLSTGVDAGRAVMGFHRVFEPGAVTDVQRCLLAEEPITKAWEALREAAERGAWEIPTASGTRITIRAAADDNLDVLVRGDRPVALEAVRDLLAVVPGLVGWHQAPNGQEPVHVAGRKTLADVWQGIEFDLPADVFLQVNRQVSVEMDRWLDLRMGDLAGRRVLDLYSGVGARAIKWARSGARVTTCEVSGRAAEACRVADHGSEGRLDVLTDRVENRLADLLPADTVVVNPPRTGLSRRVSETLVSGSAARLAYVSCDPATLARDLGRLRTAWNLVDVQPFDAFPQTAHVETVAWLHRA
jgi:23S rRNA (uracil1939-C5)-methyltransferase